MAVVRFEMEDSLTTLLVPQLTIQTINRARRFAISLCRCLHFTGKAGRVRYCGIIAMERKSYVVSSRRWHCVLSGLKIIYIALKCTFRTNESLRVFSLSCYETHNSL